MLRIVLLNLLVIAVSLAGCSRTGSKSITVTLPQTGTANVYTSFYPTTYFAQRIAGDAATVTCPVPDDADAIFWMPGDAEIAAYQAADLIVLNGAEFEKWADKVTLPESKVVRTADGFKDSWIEFSTQSTHSHGPEGDHTHQGLDGHTWLDPNLAIEQATAIERALTRIRPDQADAFTAGLESLILDLKELDLLLKAASKNASQVWVYASHPAYNYPAKRYGWRMVNLDLDPDVMPADATFGEIAASLKEKPAKFLVWESTPIPAIEKRVREELGLESVTVSPAELMDAESLASGETYLSTMKKNTEILKRVLTP